MTAATVLDLNAYRAALHAREVLITLLQAPDWLLGCTIRFCDGHPVLVVTVTARNEANVCVPVEVNRIQVRVVRAGAGRNA